MKTNRSRTAPRPSALPVTLGLLVFLSAVAPPSPARAQSTCTTGSLSPGSTVTGTLSSTDCLVDDYSYSVRADRYLVAGTAGQELSFDLTGSPNLRIRLKTPGGAPFPEPWWGYGDGFAVTLPISGTWTVEVFAYIYEIGDGAYSLSMNSSRICAPTPIAFGEVASGELVEGDCAAPPADRGDLWTFTGTVGQAVSIRMTSDAFDTYLYLYGQDGKLLASNDDFGDGTASRIDLQLASTGTFIVAASSYLADGLGAYELALTENSSCSTTPIVIGQEVATTLGRPGGCPAFDGRFTDFYEFDAAAGEQVRVRFSSNAFSGSLRLIGPGGSEITSASAQTASEALLDARIDETGKHWIALTSSKSGAKGNYRVGLEALVCSSTPIEIGQTVSAAFTASDCLSSYGPQVDQDRADFFVFSGEAGERVFLDAGYSGQANLYLEGPDGNLLAFDDRDVSPYRYGKLLLTLPSAGTYRLETNSSFKSYVAYELATKSCGSEPIGFGQTLENTLTTDDCPSVQIDPYLWGNSHAFTHVFEGTAGQRVVLAMSSSTLLPQLNLVGPDGTRVVPKQELLSSGTRRMVASLPASGSYSIEAGLYQLDGAVTYSLTLIDLANDLIFADDFETGDLSRWSASSTKGGKLSVLDAAGRLDGHGLHFDVTDLPPPASRAKLWVKDTSPNGEARYRARFFLDLNSLTVPTASRTLRLMTARTASDAAARPFEVRLVYEDGIWSLVGIARDNSGTVASKTAAISIPRAWVQVVVDWKAASRPGANDGFLVLAVNGSTLVGVGDLANDEVRIDGIQLGLLGGVGLSSTGTMFIDDFESRREGPFSPPYAPPAAAFTGGTSGSLVE